MGGLDGGMQRMRASCFAVGQTASERGAALRRGVLAGGFGITIAITQPWHGPVPGLVAPGWRPSAAVGGSGGGR